MARHELYGLVDQADVAALLAALAAKAADTAVVHLTGTETIAGTKIFESPPQVPVGTQLTHPVRRDDARLTDARAPTTHTHPTPLVPNPPLTLAHSSSLTADATLGNYRFVTATSDLTLNPPTFGADGQLWRVRIVASGAQRTLTLASGLRRPSHIGTTVVIASGRRGDVGLLYEGADSAWTVLAAQTA